MKILAISDYESPYLWDYFTPDKVEGVDLILSCGDLNPDYLSFLVTLSHAPVLYVHGNHDGRYEKKPPQGCVCIEDQVYNFQGVRILGLGGSMRYHNGPHQYTQAQMNLRVLKLYTSLRLMRGFDILVTHAPPHGICDTKDLAHEGFLVFNRLVDRFHPAVALHGHVHLNYGHRLHRESMLGETRVINAYDHYLFEI